MSCYYKHSQMTYAFDFKKNNTLRQTEIARTKLRIIVQPRD